ncbi:hypothetical protein ANN_19572 [Periplaneta americana]|uniref:HAT C-terminal dimerisation domain-containing protein n=1 Tax=Periplaneta americana TaxID=6978 RepID=A0ABQ8SA88_PERAM|nr:hypothetical protein ANN_19572 [Periplaneta americana]
MFDKDKLKTELTVLYQRQEFRNISDAVKLLQFLQSENLQASFSEVVELLRIAITIPMTTSESELCFSCLKRAKSHLRNTMREERLTALAMFSIVKTMAYGNGRKAARFYQSEYNLRCQLAHTMSQECMKVCRNRESTTKLQKDSLEFDASLHASLPRTAGMPMEKDEVCILYLDIPLMFEHCTTLMEVESHAFFDPGTRMRWCGRQQAPTGFSPPGNNLAGGWVNREMMIMVMIKR